MLRIVLFGLVATFEVSTCSAGLDLYASSCVSVKACSLIQQDIAKVPPTIKGSLNVTVFKQDPTDGLVSTLSIAPQIPWISLVGHRLNVLGPALVCFYLFVVTYFSGTETVQRDGADDTDRSLRASIFRVTCWISFSICLSLWNKWTMIPQGVNFPYPVSICVVHMFVTSVVVWGMRLARPQLFRGLVELRLEHAKPLILPVMTIGGLGATTIMFSNYSVKHLSVAFINLIKAANPAHALVLALIFKTMDSQKSQYHVMMGILLMFGGALITCLGEAQFSTIGLCYFTIGVLTEQLRLILLKWLLAGSKITWDPFSTVAVVSPIAFIFLVILAVIVEGPYLPYAQLMSDTQLQHALLTGALVAVAVNVSYVHLLDVISPVTFTVCGVGKDIVTAVMSLCLGGSITPWQMLGYLITVSGVAYYDQQQVIIKASPKLSPSHSPTINAPLRLRVTSW